MFARSLACAFLVLAGATAQESSAEGFMTIQTSMPSSPTTTAIGGESTSACVEVCVVDPCTQCPITDPIRPSVTSEIPQLTFCRGTYTDVPCSSVTGEMSIPAGETPISSAGSTMATDSSASTTSGPTSSVSGSVGSSTSTPGAAASIPRPDGTFLWAAALSGLSATLGFAWTLL